MKSRIITSVCAALALLAMTNVSANAENKNATPTNVKIGYFNLALVKAAYPGGNTDSMRNTAEQILRNDVQRGNELLKKAQDDKKPKEEIEKLASQIQTEINAQQAALAQLVSAQTQQANQSIAQVVNAVAAKQGLDMVVDGQGVFAGGQKVIENGVDITQELVKALNPATQLNATAPSTPAAAPAKTGSDADKK
jgi:Skp family chaperone for outer membrane proteins